MAVKLRRPILVGGVGFPLVMDKTLSLTGTQEKV